MAKRSIVTISQNYVVPPADTSPSLGPVKFVTSSYILTDNDYTICADCSRLNIIIVCPATLASGKQVNIKRVDNNPDTYCILTSDSPTPEFTSELIRLSAQWDAVSIQWTGTKWIQI